MNERDAEFAVPAAVRHVGTWTAASALMLALVWWHEFVAAEVSNTTRIVALAAVAVIAWLRDVQLRRAPRIAAVFDSTSAVAALLFACWYLAQFVDAFALGTLAVAIVATFVPDARRGRSSGRILVITTGLALFALQADSAAWNGLGLFATIALFAFLRVRAHARSVPLGKPELVRAGVPPLRMLVLLVSFGAVCVATMLLVHRGVDWVADVAREHEDSERSGELAEEARDQAHREARLRAMRQSVSNRIDPVMLASEPTGLEGGIHRFEVRLSTVDERPLAFRSPFLLTDFHPPAPWRTWTERDAQGIERLGESAGGTLFASFAHEPRDDDVLVRIDGVPVQLEAGFGDDERVDVLVPHLSPAAGIRIEASNGAVGTLVRLGSGDLALQPATSGADRFVVRVASRALMRASFGAERFRGDLATQRARPTSPLDVEPAPRFDGDDVLFTAAADVLATSGTDLARVEAITEWLAYGAFRYDLDATTPGLAGVGVLARERRGKCLQFATAALVLLRRAGIASRLARGHLVHDYDEERGLYDVWSRDAHAFVEVHFERAGWVPFDATPPIPDADAPTTDSSATEESTTERTVSADGSTFDERDTAHLVLALAAAMAALQWFLNRRRRRAAAADAAPEALAPTPDQQLLAQMLAILARLGQPIRRAQTLREFAQGASRALGPRVEPFTALVPRFERSRFGGQPLDADERTTATRVRDALDRDTGRSEVR